MTIPFELLECVGFWSRHASQRGAVRANGVEWSYADLFGQTMGVSQSLQGVPSGRLAVLARSKRDTALGVLGALASGCSAIVLNPHLPIEYLEQCLEQANPSALVFGQVDRATWSTLSRCSTALLRLPAFEIPVANPAPATGHSLYEVRGESEWGILYSSGSTADPKGIERDYESMQTEFIGWCLELGLSPRTRFYIARPVFYTGGLVLSMATLLAGGCIIVNDLKDASIDDLVADILMEARNELIDWVFLVPDQVRTLLRSPLASRLRGLIRTVLVMGAPISGREKQALSQALACGVIESWGNSESLGTITDSEMLVECPDSVGRPFIGDTMLIVDDNGDSCAPGVIGRIAGGEAAGFTRYTKRPQETAQARRGGLIISEDLGWIDDVGRLFVAGRLQERLEYAGGSVFLPGLEEALRRAGLDVPFCLAKPEQPESNGVGLLYEEGGLSVTEVERCAGAADLEVPVIRIRATRTLPQTASGKVDRAVAARLLWKEQ